MKSLPLLILSFFVLQFPSSAQEFDPDLQYELWSTVDNWFDPEVLVGVNVALVASDGQWTTAVGADSVGIPMSTNKPMAIASVSKTIISAVILQMYEEGLLDLDDPFSNHLDIDLEFVDPEITIRQLLNHTSGVYNFNEHPNFWPSIWGDLEYPFTPEEVLSSFLDEPYGEPGTVYHYSNSGYILLGMVIESISGNPYYEEAASRFDFANNYPSFKAVPHDRDLLDLADFWRYNIGSQQFEDAHALGIVHYSTFYAYGASASYSAIPEDVAKWAYDLYSGSLLNMYTMDELFELPDYVFTSYGLGVQITSSNCTGGLVGHAGGLYHLSNTYYDEEYDVAVSVHTNQQENGVVQIAKDLICTYVEYQIVSSQDPIPVTENLSIHPNPTSEHLFIDYYGPHLENASLLILDYMGRTLFSESVIELPSNGTHSINFGNLNLPAGSYLLQLKSNSSLFVEPFYVEAD